MSDDDNEDDLDIESMSPKEILFEITRTMPLAVIADDRWEDEGDDFGIGVLGFIFYGYALKIADMVSLAADDVDEAMLNIFVEYVGTAPKWTSGLVAEARRSAADDKYHPGQYELTQVGAGYADTTDVHAMAKNVYANLKRHRQAKGGSVSGKPPAKTGNQQNEQDFNHLKSDLATKGGPAFANHCIAQGNCELKGDILEKLKSVLKKYPVEDEDEYDFFAVVVRDRLIAEGLLEIDDPKRFQYQLVHLINLLEEDIA